MDDKQRIEYFMSEIARLSNQVVDLQNERDALDGRLDAMAVNRDAFREAAYKAISIVQVNNMRLPQGYGDECLAEIRAEAGRAGFVAGAEMWSDYGVKSRYKDDYLVDIEADADKYAAKVRNTGAWLKDSNVNGGKRQGGEK